MANMMNCVLGALVLLAVSVWTGTYSRSLQFGRRSSGLTGNIFKVLKRTSGDGDDEGEGDPTVGEQLEEANRNLNGVHVDGDIAVSHLPTQRSVDSCVLRGCMWPKAEDGKVYVPYVIANHYYPQELDIIKEAISSFSNSTCIRFFPRTDQMDFLYIQSLGGCYSYVGRQGDGQIVSLNRHGCIYYGIIQHELLHALGFNHEHNRSDRDQHIRVLLQNIRTGKERNFKETDTLNQETPYDYSSVLHYGRQAFSKDDSNPTMMAVPNPSTVFGEAKQMNQNDLDRINLLYCNN